MGPVDVELHCSPNTFDRHDYRTTLLQHNKIIDTLRCCTTWMRMVFAVSTPSLSQLLFFWEKLSNVGNQFRNTTQCWLGKSIYRSCLRQKAQHASRMLRGWINQHFRVCCYCWRLTEDSSIQSMFQRVKNYWHLFSSWQATWIGKSMKDGSIPVQQYHC